MSENPRQPILSAQPRKSRFSRACEGYRRGGFAYVWHKSMRRILENDSIWKRKLIYSDPRKYWTLRGGLEYLAEQEGQPARTGRSIWLAEKVAAREPASVLEVGCGYGKQLEAIRAATGGHVSLTGIDFSPTQLGLAAERLGRDPNLLLVLGDGQRLPFPDQSFDLVLTSAVILHNEPKAAERMRAEIVRVARRWCMHNEDTDTTYNRFGYDTAQWYRRQGLKVVEAGSIPGSALRGSEDPAGESARSQFCLARPR